ncbi:MAG: response regulator [Sulfurimonas sp.]|nr:response regulator [Sulfurimonas sp.]
MNREKLEKLRQHCKSISVLYVEDDTHISEQLEKLLKKIFLKIDVEKNGALGLESFIKNNQDIVITDISMPMLDGIEMSKRIRLLNPEQNIIVTSAHSDTESLLSLIEIGVDKFILKPIDMGVLLETISRVAVNIYRAKKALTCEHGED